MDVLNRYRDNNASSDDDSENSEKECNVWKRATTVKRMVEEEILQVSQNEEASQVPANPKRKKNTIWTEVLRDQLISEDLEDCLLKNKPAHFESRGKESYDYTLKYSDPRNENFTECSMDEEKHNDPKNRTFPSPHNSKTKKYPKLNDVEYNAAQKIIKVLNEKKKYLIHRIVKTVGIEKAMTLLAMTEEIEDSGGMMINNNARRRTPGGVYIQLLKTDKGVTPEMLDTIFEGELSCSELKKVYAEKKKLRKKFHRKNRQQKPKESAVSKNMENDVTPMDDQETGDIISCPENSSIENNPTSISFIAKNSTENPSDLEEGEIEE